MNQARYVGRALLLLPVWQRASEWPNSPLKYPWTHGHRLTQIVSRDA
jgi:hypothetical protein